MVLGVSAKEWAINMLKEETELDTLALIAIRNMLGVSFFFATLPLLFRMQHALFELLVYLLCICKCSLVLRTVAHLCYPLPYVFAIYRKFLYTLSQNCPQVPMCVVAPGKQPVTETERALSISSGHIIHLMPGDNHYDPSSFCVVLAWNGLNHYTPTYLMKHSSILQHRCSVINRLLSTATELFSDIESDLDESKDEDLIDHFHNLRD